MKVVFINSVYNVGSTGKLVHEQKTFFENQGIESYVFYGRGNSSEKNTYKISNKISILAHVLESRLFDRHGLSSKRDTRRLIKYLKEIQPDSIILHNIHGYYVNYELLFMYLKTEFKGKIYWVFHDTWTVSGHSAYIKENREPLGIAVKDEIAEYPKSFFLNCSQKNLEKKKQTFGDAKFTIITPSYWLANLLKKTYLNSHEVKTIHNGINSAFFYLDKDVVQANKTTVLCVANIWEERKGIKFIQLLLEDNVFDKYNFIIIGKISSNKGFKNNVKFINQTKSIDELRYYYNIADVFLNPTLFDNFPTVNIEALMCGLPVVTFNTGGSKECIVSSEMGRVIEPSDIEALKESVLSLLETSTIEKKIKIASKASMFSQNNMLEKYYKIISGDLK